MEMFLKLLLLKTNSLNGVPDSAESLRNILLNQDNPIYLNYYYD